MPGLLPSAKVERRLPRLCVARLRPKSSLRPHQLRIGTSHMPNEPNRNNRTQAILAWVGMAGALALMWWFLAE